jgi:chromosome segregation ATPase
MLYLISLQDLSQSPFRVVDEINQGMDPRNERMVHKQIVRAACGNAGDPARSNSQYFLITPKLLADLEYHEDICVMCIWNGAWQPAELDVAAYVKRALAKRGSGGVGVSQVGKKRQRILDGEDEGEDEGEGENGGD